MLSSFAFKFNLRRLAKFPIHRRLISINKMHFTAGFVSV